MLAVFAAAIIALSPAGSPPACLNEDGNPDGSTCVWTDPGTGTQYLVDSRNYRE